LRSEYDFSKARKGKYSRRFEMSLQQCTVDGKAGWQWGNGKCHTGRTGKERAETEGSTELGEVLHDLIEVVKEKQVKAKVSAPKTEAVKTVVAEAPPKRRGPAKKKT